MPTFRIMSEMSGTLIEVSARVGSQVAQGDTLIVLESMKMEIPVTAPGTGRVTEVCAAEGDVVNEGDLLVVLES